MIENFAQYAAAKEQRKACKQAGVRVGISWALHLLTVPPVVSLIYSAKTENWAPFAAATGVAVLAAPFALFDLGFTFLVAPPITSAVLLQTKAGERRRQLGIAGPEEADVLAFSNFQTTEKVEK
tara:strand:+ start:203 stop:574 length:372 start_codon:yes stop_codon:yes gene_type:complete